MEEISILDYVKAKLTFWKKSDLHIPDLDDDSDLREAEPLAALSGDLQPLEGSVNQDTRAWLMGFPWLALAPLLLALIAQVFIEPPMRSVLSAWYFMVFLLCW